MSVGLATYQPLRVAVQFNTHGVGSGGLSALIVMMRQP